MASDFARNVHMHRFALFVLANYVFHSFRALKTISTCMRRYFEQILLGECIRSARSSQLIKRRSCGSATSTIWARTKRLKGPARTSICLHSSATACTHISVHKRLPAACFSLTYGSEHAAIGIAFRGRHYRYASAQRKCHCEDVERTLMPLVPLPFDGWPNVARNTQTHSSLCGH